MFLIAEMTGRDWAMVALILSIALVFFVTAAIIANLIRVVNSVKSLLDGVTKETVPLIGEVGNSVRQVNKELERADAIIGSVQRVAHNVELVSDTVRVTVTNPLVKALAFLAGARKGAKSLGGK
jgi:methyl-accepting chemotaxis protein